MMDRKETRTEVRCETCLTTMERRDHEKRFVCRSNPQHVEPFRDEFGIITDRKQRRPVAAAEPAPVSEPEPGPLSTDNITRLREQVPTEKRGEFDSAVEAAGKARTESESRIHAEQDEAIAGAQAKHERAMLAAGAAHDKKVRTALASALGIEPAKAKSKRRK